MFRRLDAGAVVVTLVAFVAMIGIWCVTADWLGSRLAALATIRRFSHPWVLLVLIAIAATILTQSVIS